ncbi:MAG TPA: AlkA N-terminal domain-containing protein [Trichormus sp.]|jgi:AraC family transcriptional regulator of adaptative response / DNA-3-methyladenine glycosylase II
MKLDSTICYQALLTHDPRFDGVFFVGVSSTRIYCRTVCTAKIPAFKNCTFFMSAAAAEQAGYRPCLRCRPELAPGTAKVDAVSRLAIAVARRIEDGALAEMSVADLSEEMGVSERHLRRVVETEFGVSPIELAQTQRLLLAKRLLTDTQLPVTEIAFSSGFASVRRFNALFLERYRLNPTQLRRTRKSDLAVDEESILCALSYRPPFDWVSLIRFLAARTAGGAEAVINNPGSPDNTALFFSNSSSYVRTARFGEHTGWISVSPSATKNALMVKVSLSLSRALMPVLTGVKRLFDLNADPHQIGTHLGTLAITYPGLRVPGAFDGFEIALRAILGQQVTVKAATTLMTRFVQKFGEPIETPFAELKFISPNAEKVSKLAVEEIISIGVIRARAVSIIAMANAIATRQIILDRAFDPEKTMSDLKELPGIGDWTAHYIAMRAMNWPDAFPHSDLGIRKALNETNNSRVLAMAEKWRPWRSYAAMHLWKTLEVGP